MPYNIIEQLKKSDLVKSFEKVSFDSLDISNLSEKLISILKINSDQLQAYELFYISNNHLVHGFFLAPLELIEGMPCVIYNRGGNRDFGEILKEDLFKGIFYPAILALNGYCVIMSNYSGSSQSEGVDEFGGSEIDDVVLLREIISEIKFIDMKKIGMFGASRGGVMTYSILSKFDWLAAAITVAGVSNQFRNIELREKMKITMSEMFELTNEELEKRSAVHWPDKFCDTTPLLMLHGTSDWRVSVLDSIELAQKLYEHKKPFSLKIYEGGDHNLSEFAKERNGEILKWFDRYLKNNEVLPNLELHGN